MSRKSLRNGVANATRYSTNIANVAMQACIIVCLLVCSFVNRTSGLESTKVSIAEVKEILRSRCSECHSAEASSTDFDVLSSESLVKSAVVKAGKPEESKLMNVIVSEDEEIRMPQDLPALSPSEIDKVRLWIAEGDPPAFPGDVVMPERAIAKKRLTQLPASITF